MGQGFAESGRDRDNLTTGASLQGSTAIIRLGIPL
jgi:hypothetical protein